MKSFYIEQPDNPETLFTEFFLSPLCDPRTKLACRPEMLSRYKLHINLDDAFFAIHRDAITKMIKQHGSSNGISGFKYFKVHKGNLPECQKHRNSLDLKNVLIALLEAAKHPSNTNQHKQYLDQAKLLIQKLARPLLKQQLNELVKHKLDAKLLNIFLTKTNRILESDLRFIGQAQFTLYLMEPLQTNNNINFLKLLYNDLKSLGAASGDLPNTDLRIVELFNLFSFRQECFDETPNDYVAGTSENPAQLAKDIAHLKEQAGRCELFKALTQALTAHVNTIDAKAAPASVYAGNTTTFKSTSSNTAASDQTSTASNAADGPTTNPAPTKK